MLYSAKYLSMKILRRMLGLGLLVLACAAAHAGICAAVLPLKEIAPKVKRLFSGDRS